MKTLLIASTLAMLSHAALLPVAMTHTVTITEDAADTSTFTNFPLWILDLPNLPPRECEVHHAPLESIKVRIVYGLPLEWFEPIEFATRYPTEPSARTRNALFPYAREFAIGGCCITPETSEMIYFCRYCKEAEKQWGDAAHPHLQK